MSEEHRSEVSWGIKKPQFLEDRRSLPLICEYLRGSSHGDHRISSAGKRLSVVLTADLFIAVDSSTAAEIQR